jgi:DNA-binding NarL/FixJ family response regulator
MIKMRERILIVARPGRLRDALRALMATIPQLEIVDQVEDRAVALKMVTEQHPTLILMDSSLPDNEVKVMLEQIKAERSQIYCIVLANTEQQEQLAISAGADEVLLKGFPTANLFAVIEKVMSRQEGELSKGYITPNSRPGSITT